jgi:2-amino-4-hydroxy-6-hydroxymethyldihydropteridine diphosphokinase
VSRAYFSLGSNLGDRGEHLRQGVATVTADDPSRLSRVYQTAPVGGVPQDDFWNLIVEVTTKLAPRELLARAQHAEALAQRRRDLRWGPRTLDVDIVWIDGVVRHEPDLLVPHPRMAERNFVLVPLRELRPDLVSDDDLARARGAVAVVGTLEELH